MILRSNPENSKPGMSKQAVFITVFVLLCGLTGTSFWVAHSWIMDNPIFGWSVMISISIAKAMLVVSFFMHLWWERAWKYALTIPTLLLGGLLVILLVPDVGMRTRHYSNDRIMLGPQTNSKDDDLAKSRPVSTQNHKTNEN